MTEELKRRQKLVTISLLIIYLVVLTWIILFKMTFSFEELPHLRKINLVPFAGSVIINQQIDLDEIINNILIFIPFGIYMGMLKPDWRLIKNIAPIASISLLFEVTQYIFAIGATDITDFLGNTLGGIIGISAYFVLCKLFKTEARTNRILNLLAIIGTVGVIALMGLLILSNR